jgi:hypothetical protein
MKNCACGEEVFNHPAADVCEGVDQAEMRAFNNEVANLIEAEKPMYAVHYGEAHDEELSVKECAAEIRKHLRKLSKAKHSPLAGVKVSVRYQSFSGGSAIDVRLSVPYPVRVEDEEAELDARREGERYPWLTPAARAAKLAAEEIHGAYNYNGSDSQIDYFHVKYYGHVEIEEAK